MVMGMDGDQKEVIRDRDAELGHWAEKIIDVVRFTDPVIPYQINALKKFIVKELDILLKNYERS